MIVECKNCLGFGRVRSGPVPTRAQGYLETQCWECHGSGQLEDRRSLTPYELSLELECMADLCSAGFLMSAPQEAALRKAAIELRKISHGV